MFNKQELFFVAAVIALVSCGGESTIPATDSTVRDTSMVDAQRTDTATTDSNVTSDSRVMDSTATDSARADVAADSGGRAPLCAEINGASCRTPSQCAYGVGARVRTSDSCPNSGSTGATCCVPASTPPVEEPCCVCGGNRSRAIYDSVDDSWDCDGTGSCALSPGRC